MFCRFQSQLLSATGFLFTSKKRKDAMTDASQKNVEPTNDQPDRHSLEHLYTALIRSYLRNVVAKRVRSKQEELPHAQAQV